MKQSIKMIGFDLDGTLLTSDKKIGTYTKEILDEAIRRGIIVLPVTGRPLAGVPEELKSYKGIDYMITSNGARVVEHGKSIFERLVSVKTSRNILDIFEDYDTLREIYYDGQGYAQRDKMEQMEKYMKTPVMAEYILRTRLPVEDLNGKFAAEDRPLDKVQALFTSQEEKKEAWKRIEALGDVEVTGALSNNIEVNASGVHKGNALLWLAQRLGIQREEIMAFGDGANDIKMMRDAGIGVAMENSIEAVKEAADMITVSNDAEGVAHTIENYILKSHT